MNEITLQDLLFISIYILPPGNKLIKTINRADNEKSL